MGQFTSILSSFIVENEGKKLAVYEEQKEIEDNELLEKILIPVSDKNTIPHLIDLSMMIKDTSSEEPVFALCVVRDSLEPETVIMKSSKKLDQAVDYASAGESMLRVVTSVDLNIANGILRGIKELVISDIVLEWKGKFNSKVALSHFRNCKIKGRTLT